MYHRTQLPEGTGMSDRQAQWSTRGDGDITQEYIQSSSSSHPNAPAGYSDFAGGQPTIAQVSHAYPAANYFIPHPSQSVVSHPSFHHGAYLDIQQGYGFERYPAPYSNAHVPYQNHHSHFSPMGNPLDTAHATPFGTHDQLVSRQLQGTYISQDTNSFAHRATSPAGIASATSHPHAYDLHMSSSPGFDGGVNGATTVQRPSQRTSAAARFAPSSSTAPRPPRTFEDLPSPDPTNAVSSTPTATYACMWSSRGRRCGGRVEGEKNSIAQHLRDCHDFVCDEERMTCRWDQCDMVLQRRNVARHIFSYHLGVKVLCKHCGMTLSRQDASRKHEKSCASAPKAGAAVYPTPPILP